MVLFLLQYLKIFFLLKCYQISCKSHLLWFKNSWLCKKAIVYLLEKHRCFAVWYDRLSLHLSFYLFPAYIFFHFLCMSVHAHECTVRLKFWYILEYDTFKFDSKNQFKVSQQQIYTIQNYKTTDLKIIVTMRPFMLSHKRSQMCYTTDIFNKISFFLVWEHLLNIIKIIKPWRRKKKK